MHLKKHSTDLPRIVSARAEAKNDELSLREQKKPNDATSLPPPVRPGQVVDSIRANSAISERSPRCAAFND